MTLKKIISFFLVGTSLSFLVLKAPSSVASNQPPVLRYPKRHIRFQMVPMEIKPWHTDSTFSTKANLKSTVFGHILKYDRDYNLLPGLVTEWSWDPKEMSYTLAIDSTLKYDRSRKLKPVDIEFAIVKNFISTHSVADTRLIGIIKGSEKLKKGQKFKSGMCEGVKVTASKRLKIFLKRPDPFFLFYLADLESFVSPPLDFNSDLFTFKSTPRGSWLYKIIWSDPSSSLVRIEKKDISPIDLRDGQGPLSIDLFGHGTALENNADIASGAGIDGLQEDARFKVLAHPVPRIIQLLDFNSKNSLAQNKLFRRAVSLAINRKELVEGYDQMWEAHELIPDGYYGKSGLKFEYNPTEARKIVKEHFSSIISKSKPVKCLYHGRTGKPHKSTFLERLRTQLKNVGIYTDCTTAADMLFNKHSNDFVFLTNGRVTSFVNPASPFQAYIQNKDFASNVINDQKSKDLLERVVQTSDRSEKSKFLSRLSSHFSSDYKVIPLTQRGGIYAYKLDRIEAVELKSTFYSLDFEMLRLKK